MKELIRVLAVLVFAVTSMFQSQAQIVELPLNVGFEDFRGTNLNEVHPGWNEGVGYPSISMGTGSWFNSDLLYSSAVASVNYGSGDTRQWIISPEFKVTDSTCVFFKAAVSSNYNMPTESTMGTDDEFAVYVTEDGGSTYTKVLDVASELTYELRQYHTMLSEYKGKTVRVGFFVSDGNKQNSSGCASLDDVRIKDLNARDLSVNGFSVANNIELAKPLPFFVEVTNEGTTTLDHIALRLDVRGPENFSKVIVVDDTLAVSACKQVSLGELKLAATGAYSISVRSAIEGDIVADNDVATQSVEVLDNSVLPIGPLDFSETYRTISFYDGWVEAIADTGKLAYTLSAWQSAIYKEKSGFYVPFYGLAAFDWVISPSFVADSHTQLYFEAAVSLGDGSAQMGSDDRVSVYVSADGGLSWDEVGVIGNDNMSIDWEKYFFDLSHYAGQTIKVGLYATTGEIADNEEYDFFIDNLTIADIQSKDIKVEKLEYPQKPAHFSNDETIAVRVANCGSDTISSYTLSYRLNDGELVSEQVTDSILPQSSMVYYFSQHADLSADENSISIVAALDGDTNEGNNTLADLELSTYSYDPIIQGDYTQSFEDGEDFSAWMVIDGNNDDAKWEKHHNGDSYDYEGEYTFSYTSRTTTKQSDEWLISNGFYLRQGVEYNISFGFANRAGGAPEKLKLTMGTAQSVEAQTEVLIDLGEITNNDFMDAEKTFTVSADGYYYFAWNDYGDADQFAVYLDKISVSQKCTDDLKINRLFVKKVVDEVHQVLDSVRTSVVEIENVGTNPVSELTIGLDYANDVKELIDTFHFSQTINPGEKASFSLEKDGFAFDFNKTMTLKAYIVSEEDQNQANDTIVKRDYMHVNFSTGFEYADETEGRGLPSMWMS